MFDPVRFDIGVVILVMSELNTAEFICLWMYLCKLGNKKLKDISLVIVT